MFKIKNFTLTPIKVPLVKPLYVKRGEIRSLLILVLELFTEEGISAQSFIYGIGDHTYPAIINLIQQELMPSVLGVAFNSSDEIWQAIWLPRRERLMGGLGLYALALIDIACWDIAAKLAQKPLANLLGNHHLSAPVYGAGGWLNLSNEELYQEAANFIEKGISLYKIKIGGDKDAERLKFLRQEFRNSLQIAVDANQQFTLAQAIDKSKLLASYDVIWFEDPLFSESLSELKELSDQSKTPLCVGENFPLHWIFEDICRIDAASYLQADVVHCGGITPFLKIAALAEKYHKPFLTHFMTELSVSILMLTSTGFACEYAELFPPDLFTTSFEIKHGRILSSNLSGTGVYINADMMRTYKID